MKITIDHPASSYGVPVVLADDGAPMDYAAGIKALRELRGLSTQALADLCGVSRRTVEGWEQGRMPTTAALNVMSRLVK
jgi:DNA-binding transcriptional regulator YiaG